MDDMSLIPPTFQIFSQNSPDAEADNLFQRPKLELESVQYRNLFTVKVAVT